MKHVHFIGIGGIGMSAIARMFLLEGRRVTGSDISHSMVTSELEKAGAMISYVPSADNVSSDTELVVYTPAIAADNIELMRAEELGIKTCSYPEMLGEVSKEKYTIAVSGTHGKTTTTAMIAKILIDTAYDPTVVVGSFLKDQKSNFVAGKSKYFVAEACEYKRSFLNLYPRILVITNIEADHLDYYKDIADIQSAFRELASRLGPDDHLVCALSDPNIAQVAEGLSCQVHDYTAIAELQGVAEPAPPITLPGVHNKKNAYAALVVAGILGVSRDKAVTALNAFSGTWRRFEYKGKTKNGATVYDDYAHHPTEIKATLQAARELFPDKHITAVFQPHLYSRTKDLLSEFSEAFKEADALLLAPIYAAREANDPSISSDILAEKIRAIGGVGNGDASGVHSCNNFSEIVDALSRQGEHDVILVMGAGDIGKLADLLVS